ncbi:MAG: flagellar hook-associated protein FlgK [Deltaproteobacteria bacterium]|nr:flagellar hook-associated protein FlgK [Deltaproteobacteria bacterium]
MTNFGAKILNNATTALAAQQAVLATIGNNIANANTAGYARRVLDLQTRLSTNGGGLNVGNGVDVGALIRVADQYVQKALQDSASAQGSSEIELEFLSRLEGLFSLTGDKPTIGSSLTQFFNAVNDLTVDPASIELRTNVMERAQDLVTVIRNTYNGIAALQKEADTRVGTEIDIVNSITGKIAELNGIISQSEALGITAADERDRRDVLLKQLSEKLSFSQVETSDGSVTVSLANGFSLVSGTTSRRLEMTENPSFGIAPIPNALDGSISRYVVYDFDAGVGQAHIDLTQFLKNGEGSIAGLLRVRGYNAPDGVNQTFDSDGILVEMASRVEAVTRVLLTQVNRTYLGPDEDAGTPGHQPSSVDLDGNTAGSVANPYALFDFSHTGAKDPNGNRLPDDLTNPALGISNFSSILQLNFTDPRRFAAALESDPGNPMTTPFQTGNGANALAIANLQTDNTLIFTVGGPYSLTGTFDEAYNESVSHVGAAKSRAEINATIADANLVSAQSRRDSISGVSLDEEFSDLIRFQRAYQASARMVRVADELLEQIVSLI